MDISRRRVLASNKQFPNQKPAGHIANEYYKALIVLQRVPLRHLGV